MLALVRHHCPCGRSYVVSLAGDDDLRRHPEWGADAASAAAAAGQVLVDGRGAGFVCPSCSRLHVRVAPPVFHAVGGDEPPDRLLSFTLN